MEQLTFTTTINASTQKVWHAMLDDATYRQWTRHFSPGSHYQGEWVAGSEMRFMGMDENGNSAGGMYSVIEEVRPAEYVSIKHLGMISATGEIDTTSDDVKSWAPAFENYTFTDIDGATQLQIDLTVPSDWKDMFDDMWPKALAELKEIAEN